VKIRQKTKEKIVGSRQFARLAIAHRTSSWQKDKTKDKRKKTKELAVGN
jgi:hypothetical protein